MTAAPTPQAPQRDWASTGMAMSIAFIFMHVLFFWVAGAAISATHGGGAPGPGDVLPVLLKQDLAAAGFTFFPAPTVGAWTTAAWIFSLVFGVSAAGWSFLITSPPPLEIHQEGRQVRQDAGQVQAQMSERETLDGVRVHPQITISRAREKQHLLLLGGTGAGKTQILLPLIQQARERGDRLLLYDYKGDLTETLPGDPPDEPGLLAPWDSRSLYHDISIDVASFPDAQTFCLALIPNPESGEIHWNAGARDILTGLVVHLQKTHGQLWGWGDLSKLACEPYHLLRRAAVDGYPPVGGLLPDLPPGEQPNDNIMSYLSTMAAGTSPVHALAMGWPTRPNSSSRRWSVSKFIHGDGPATMILQGNLSAQAVQTAYLQTVMGLLLAQVGSPGMESRDHKIWVVLDEFIQIGRLDQVLPLLQVARSKGVRLALASQDTSGMEDVYNANVVKSMLSIVGTRIFGACAGPAAEISAGHLGKRRILKYNPTRTDNMATALMGAASTVSHSWQPYDKEIFSIGDFSTKLGQIRTGRGEHDFATRALVDFTGAPDIALIDWPRTIFRPVRPAHQAAQWILPTAQTVPAQARRQEIDQAAESTAPQAEESEDELVMTTDPLQKLAADAVENTAGDAGAEIADQVAGQPVEHLADAVMPGAGLALEVAHAALEVLDTSGDVAPAPEVVAVTKKRKWKRRT